MAHGLFMLPEDVECVYCGKTPCPCGEPDDPEPRRDIDVVRFDRHGDYSYSVFVDGIPEHEGLSKCDLERMGLDHLPVQRVRTK